PIGWNGENPTGSRAQPRTASITLRGRRANGRAPVIERPKGVSRGHTRAGCNDRWSQSSSAYPAERTVPGWCPIPLLPIDGPELQGDTLQYPVDRSLEDLLVREVERIV